MLITRACSARLVPCYSICCCHPATITCCSAVTSPDAHSSGAFVSRLLPVTPRITAPAADTHTIIAITGSTATVPFSDNRLTGSSHHGSPVHSSQHHTAPPHHQQHHQQQQQYPRHHGGGGDQYDSHDMHHNSDVHSHR
jgi:hypothetical protein